jgi:hypothetical protein
MEKLQKCVNFILTVPVFFATSCIYIFFYFCSYTKDNVTFYLPRPFHFLSYQSNRLLRRSDLFTQ